MENRQCLRCHSSRVEPGAIESLGRSHFKLEHTKFLTLQTSDVSFRGFLCLDCGSIELVGDVTKAQALVSSGKPS